MKRTIADLLIVLVLSLGGSICLVAQNPSVDGFLDKVSAHPIGDEEEQNQFLEIGNSILCSAGGGRKGSAYRVGACPQRR